MRRLLIIQALSLLTATGAYADPIEFVFRGHMTQAYTSASGHIDIQVGDPFDGTLLFDPEALLGGSPFTDDRYGEYTLSFANLSYTHSWEFISGGTTGLQLEDHSPPVMSIFVMTLLFAPGVLTGSSGLPAILNPGDFLGGQITGSCCPSIKGSIDEFHAVPEPSTLALLGVASLVGAYRVRRRRARDA